MFSAIVTIDALYQIIGKMTPPPSPAGLAFSIVEALYARGFVSAASITEMSEPDFQHALIGTIAYISTAAIYAAASIIQRTEPNRDFAKSRSNRSIPMDRSGQLRAAALSIAPRSDRLFERNVKGLRGLDL